ncbi:hypothetical protein OH76DRAFT_1484770 [Lentinus brumalis]|uniref:F-box domain-containing protein n=1 Tax=Lentinus brumalis TaxID=2498619 RepID=A0A371D4E4_9APHY|nr:hypothetical protein OH76DRAFT_1484770 [Polyporus brumalis]
MVTTRSQHQATILEVASKTPLQETKRLYSVEELISFVELATVDPEYGTVVTFLRLNLTVSSLNRDIFDKYLPTCLVLTPNVTILELYVVPVIPTTALSDILLPAIEVLETNLPHRVLVPFVGRNPSIRALQLRHCGRARQCALSTVTLEHVNEIHCPAKCAPAIVHEKVDRLRLDIRRNSDLSSEFLSRFRAPLSTLYVLTIEFGVEDADILRAIARNMPWLRNLKMIEKCGSPVHKHKARPWADRARWSGTLQKLPQLERLLISTHGALSTTVGDHSSEEGIFRRWVGPSHPSLSYIGVWQRVSSSGSSHAFGDNVFSEWSREDGIWRGKWTKNADVDDFAIF